MTTNKENKIAFAGKKFEIINVEGIKYAVIQLDNKVSKTKSGTGKITCVEGNATRNGKVVLQTEIAGDLYSVYPMTVYVDKKPEPEKTPSPVKSANATESVIKTITEAMQYLPKNSKEYKALQTKLAEESMKLAGLL